jgi:hypothetical protein
MNRGDQDPQFTGSLRCRFCVAYLIRLVLRGRQHRRDRCLWERHRRPPLQREARCLCMVGCVLHFALCGFGFIWSGIVVHFAVGRLVHLQSQPGSCNIQHTTHNNSDGNCGGSVRAALFRLHVACQSECVPVYARTSNCGL